MDSILIVGCGNMGGAMLAGWLAAGFDPARFTVVDPVLAEAPAGVRLLREVPAEAFDVVLLGIKPQALGEVAPALEPATRGAIV
ncbi:MAG: NAD(P)-binding domain-containing protein, partial [Novosphingobium sp.]|nr:NAD(P)-binding domain-containing protein [Novosphingobium sp.]